MTRNRFIIFTDGMVFHSNTTKYKNTFGIQSCRHSEGESDENTLAINELYCMNNALAVINISEFMIDGIVHERWTLKVLHHQQTQRYC